MKVFRQRRNRRARSGDATFESLEPRIVLAYARLESLSGTAAWSGVKLASDGETTIPFSGSRPLTASEVSAAGRGGLVGGDGIVGTQIVQSSQYGGLAWAPYYRFNDTGRFALSATVRCFPVYAPLSGSGSVDASVVVTIEPDDKEVVGTPVTLELFTYGHGEIKAGSSHFRATVAGSVVPLNRFGGWAGYQWFDVRIGDTFAFDISAGSSSEASGGFNLNGGLCKDGIGTVNLDVKPWKPNLWTDKMTITTGAHGQGDVVEVPYNARGVAALATEPVAARLFWSADSSLSTNDIPAYTWSNVDLTAGSHVLRVPTSQLTATRPSWGSHLVARLDSGVGERFWVGSISESDESDNASWVATTSNLWIDSIEPDPISKKIVVKYGAYAPFDPSDVGTFTIDLFLANDSDGFVDADRFATKTIPLRSVTDGRAEFPLPQLTDAQLVDRRRVVAVVDYEGRILESDETVQNNRRPMSIFQTPTVKLVAAIPWAEKGRRYGVVLEVTSRSLVPEVLDVAVRSDDWEAMKAREPDQRFPTGWEHGALLPVTKVSVGPLETTNQRVLTASDDWQWIPAKNPIDIGALAEIKALWDQATEASTWLTVAVARRTWEMASKARELIGERLDFATNVLDVYKTYLERNAVNPVRNYSVDYTATIRSAMGELTTTASTSARIVVDAKKENALNEYKGTKAAGTVMVASGFGNIVTGALKSLKGNGAGDVFQIMQAVTLYAAGRAMLMKAHDAYNRAKDPPDPNYLEVASFQRSQAGFPGLSGAAALVFDALADARGFADARATAKDRSDGARMAGDTDAEVRQLLAASGFALDQSLALTRLTALQALGGPAAVPSEQPTPESLAALRENGWPAETVQLMRAAGLGDAEIETLRSQIGIDTSGAGEAAVDPAAVTRFQAILAGDAAIDDLRTAISLRTTELGQPTLAVGADDAARLAERHRAIDKALADHGSASAVMRLVVEQLDDVRRVMLSTNAFGALEGELRHAMWAYGVLQFTAASVADARTAAQALNAGGVMPSETTDRVVAELTAVDEALVAGDQTLADARLIAVEGFLRDERGAGRIPSNETAQLMRSLSELRALNQSGRLGAVPQAADSSLSAWQGRSVIGTVVATDPDGDPLSFGLATAPLHGTLSLRPDGSFVYTAQAGYSGQDSFVVAVTDRVDGTAFSTVSVAVQPGQPSDTTPPAVTVSPLLTKAARPTLTGTIDDATATIVLRIAGQKYQVANPGTGTWTLPAAALFAPLPEGTFDVAVVATDAFGNEGVDTTAEELTVDLTPPTVTVVPVVTNQRRPTVTGSVSDPQAVISVTIAGQTYAATNSGQGTWSLDGVALATALEAGVFSVAVVATDAAGNIGTTTAASGIRIDVTPPTVAVTSRTVAIGKPSLTGVVDDPTATIQVTVAGVAHAAVNAGDGSWWLGGWAFAAPLAKGTYDVVVTATDVAGNAASDFTTGELVVEFDDSVGPPGGNSSPTAVSLSATSVAENSAPGSAIGTLSTADPDAADTFTYALVPGEGAADNAAFAIDGSVLKTAARFNFEVRNSYSIRVRATDAGGLSTETIVAIAVDDVLDEPLLVQGVVPPATGVYGAGQRMQFSVIFSEVVQVRGTPQVQIQVGRTVRTATYAAGSGSALVTFQYAVGKGESTDRVFLGQKFVFAAKSSITAGAEKIVVQVPAGVAGFALGVVLDAVPPKVVGGVGVPASATYTVGQSLDFVVRFSETVFASGTPQIAVSGLNRVAHAMYVAGSGTRDLTFRYVVQAGDAMRGKSPLTLAKAIVLPSGAAITDVASNRAVTKIPVTPLKGILVDATRGSMKRAFRATVLASSISDNRS